tara:strand:+ start:622 stop:1305 length:684 start_codon:yes stop_codon:yes gene_type:complete
MIKFFFIKVIKRIHYFYQLFIKRNDFHIAYNEWQKVRGDELLRYEYNLNKNSIVFDLGGYKGDFASKIYNKYKSTIYIFEPIEEYYNLIVKRFLNINNVRIYNFGLSSTDEKVKINLNNDGSSVYFKSESPSSNFKNINLKNIVNFIKKNNVKKIDLMKINIEGGEFEVIPELIKTNLISRVDNLQVQFHEFIDNSKYKRDEIQKKLRKTHRLTYNYYFVWENWEKQ